MSKIRETFWRGRAGGRAVTHYRSLFVRGGVSQLGTHGFRTVRARLATARARLVRARSLRSRSPEYGDFERKKVSPEYGDFEQKFQIFQTKSDFFPIGKIGIQNFPKYIFFTSLELHLSKF